MKSGPTKKREPTKRINLAALPQLEVSPQKASFVKSSFLSENEEPKKQISYSQKRSPRLPFSSMKTQTSPRSTLNFFPKIHKSNARTRDTILSYNFVPTKEDKVT